MFTGIIQQVGRVAEAAHSSGELRLRVESPGFTDIQLGESVAVNGICLTVTEFSKEGALDFHASRETLERSNLGTLRSGSAINLERALLATDRLSGHIVQGHVDGLAKFLRARESGESHELAFELPEELALYCVEKGSIALNGVSLTVNQISRQVREQVSGCEIGIMIIPHTWRHTNFSSLAAGDHVNVEIDILAKYARRFTEKTL